MTRTTALPDLLERRAHNSHEQSGYVFLQRGETPTDRVSFLQLYHQAGDLASDIRKHSCEGDCVLLLCPPGVEFVVGLFACALAGTVAVPSYPPGDAGRDRRLKGIIKDARVRTAVTTSTILSKVQSLMPELATECGINWIIRRDVEAGAGRDFDLTRTDGNSPVILQYTSGSTGSPKGVVITHDQLMANARVICEGFGITESTVGVTWLPLNHDMGLISGVIVPLFAGCSNILMSPTAFVQKPIRWLRAITRWKGTTTCGPNFAYQMCVDRIRDEDLMGLDLSTCSAATCGSEPIRAQTIRRFSERFGPCGFRAESFIPCYGLAESTLLVSCPQRDRLTKSMRVDEEQLAQGEVIDVGETSKRSVEFVSCGGPGEMHDLRIVDPELQTEVASCKVGEIWVGGPSVAQGYFQKPQETRRVFHAHLTDTGEGPFLRTSDLGFISQGELYVTGRLRDLIRVRGLSYAPQEIETTASASHTSLKFGAGVAFSLDDGNEDQLVVICELKRTALRELKASVVFDAILKDVIEQHRIRPDSVLLVPPGVIPKTPNGKIQRHECRNRFQNGELQCIARYPDDRCDIPLAAPYRGQATDQPFASAPHLNGKEQIEAWLVQSVARRSRKSDRPINGSETFAELGLDSLEITSLSGELSSWLIRDVEPTMFYEFPTIRALATHLSTRSRESRQRISPADHGAPIAIVGMGCRFPRAESPREYWELLLNQEIATCSYPRRRWELMQSAFGEQRWTDEELSKVVAGFMADVDQFDASFFSCSATEADNMDPQQRLILEVCWEALEDAGIPPDRRLQTRTGVFIGASSTDYASIALSTDAPRGLLQLTGNSASIIANRVSHCFDLRGPSLVIDTACSSSLVSLHHACESLRRGECDLALAGGVNVLLDFEVHQALAQAGMLSPENVCRPFDEQAQGYVRGEGCGMLVLKRLNDAENEGDQVLAVIKSSSVGHDGMTNGLTAPNSNAQYAVLQEALSKSGVNASDVGYIETHGTGTPLGDPIEFSAISRAYGSDGTSNCSCCLGSVKANIGHLEAAAGIAGLIKVVLMLRHRLIPPQANIQRVNPLISLGQRFRIATHAEKWRVEQAPRVAACSSFGFGGTNAHVIVQEAPLRKPRGNHTNRSHHVLALSAKSPEALCHLAQRYVALLRESPKSALADICHSNNTGRNHFNHRFAATGETIDAMVSQLTTFIDSSPKGAGSTNHGLAPEPLRMAFIIGDDPSLSSQATHQLLESQPMFRVAFQTCQEEVRKRLPHLSLLQAQPDPSSSKASTIERKLFQFATTYSLSQMLKSWGVTPTIVIGHGLGNYSAACFAGLLDLPDALQWISREGMAAAERNWPSPDRGDGKCIAPLHTDETLLNPDRLQRQSDDKGQLVDIMFLSSRSDDHTQDSTVDDLWFNHTRETVGFEEAINTAREMGGTPFIHIGVNHQTLTSGRGAWAPGPLLSVSNEEESVWESLILTLTSLYLLGVDVNWNRVDAGFEYQKVSVPTYPFQRQSHWLRQGQKRKPNHNLTSQIQQEAHGSQREVDMQPDTQTSRHERLTRPTVSTSQRVGVVVMELQEELGTLLEIEPSEIDVSVPLSEQGVDSIAIAGISMAITKRYGIEIGMRRFAAEMQTIQQIAMHLVDVQGVSTSDPQSDLSVQPDDDDRLRHQQLAVPQPTESLGHAVSSNPSDARTIVNQLFRQQHELMRSQLETIQNLFG